MIISVVYFADLFAALLPLTSTWTGVLHSVIFFLTFGVLLGYRIFDFVFDRFLY